MNSKVAIINDEFVIRAVCSIGITDGSLETEGEAEFTIFLCPDCDQVHVHFCSPQLNKGMLQFNAGLNQEQVDKFVRLLVAPQVAF